MDNSYIAHTVSLSKPSLSRMTSVKDTLLKLFWETAAKTRMGAYLTSVEVKFFLDSIDFAKCTLVGDIGAGAGKFSLIAKQKKSDVTAMDVDLKGLKRLKLKNKHVNVVLSDAKKIPLKEDVLAAAFIIEVLDYIPELETVLAECRRILKNGGSLVFSFGNKSSLKSKFRQLRGKYYMHSYSKVVESLEKARFRIIKKEGFNWLPFNRTSESRLISLSVRVEKLFRLRKIPSLSPWVLIHAVKSE